MAENIAGGNGRVKGQNSAKRLVVVGVRPWPVPCHHCPIPTATHLVKIDKHIPEGYNPLWFIGDTLDNPSVTKQIVTQSMPFWIAEKWGLSIRNDNENVHVNNRHTGYRRTMNDLFG